ncbi:unnamed protein product [Lactuca saligna]|uniref:Uncharacterized protein n=1 Tax=Lactuca saligna TaxID=75948 RepID=A0AA35YSI3_LACSI|nr:unnamed protein product [Lactuca saligna]
MQTSILVYEPVLLLLEGVGSAEGTAPNCNRVAVNHVDLSLESLNCFSNSERSFNANEAAVASCTQQKKIEELEAQLQEAEDIVKDLREELSAVEAELERFPRSKQVKHHVQVDNASIPEPLLPKDLPSIILRSKETELYRNGCNQRIQACEQTPPEIDDTKPELIVKEDEVVDKLHIAPSVEEKEVVKEMDLTAGNSCLTSPTSVKLLEENSDKDLIRTCNGESRIT